MARLVCCTAQLANTAEEILYADAVLDASTCERLPLRLRSVRLGVNRVAGNVRIVAGYNLDLATAPVPTTDGKRVQNTLTISGTIGAGAGRLPGCDTVESLFTTINKIRPDGSGSFTIQADGCYRAERVLGFSGAGSDRSGTFPNPDAAATLLLSNDCGPCCSCEDFSYTYRGLDSVWDGWAVIARQAEQTRDIYERNLARWEAQASCRAASALRLTAIQEPGCKTFLGAIYCNASTCCLSGVRLRITVQRYNNGVLDSSTLDDLRVASAFIAGPGLTGDVPYLPRVTRTPSAMIVECFFDNVDPQTSVIIKIRLCADCTPDQTIAATATAHAGSAAPGCTLAPITVTDELAALWAAAGLDTVAALAETEALAPLDPAAIPPLCGC